MAEAVVSGILKQLGSILAQEAFKKVKLIASVKKDVDKLRSQLIAIQAVLIDAEEKQVKENAVRQWLDKLKYACSDIEDVLDEWNTKMMELEIQGGHDDQTSLTCLARILASVCSFFTSSCFDIKEVSIHLHFARKIKRLNENLNEIDKEKNSLQFIMSQPSDQKLERIESTTFVDVSDICGRDKEKNDLVSKLLSESSAETKGVKIISLIGMGGIGKTALAQYAYHHHQVIKNFHERIWVCVSDPFDVHKIAKSIIKKIEGRGPDFHTLNDLLDHLHESIKNRKFLLILDDVWPKGENKWEPLYNCLKNGLHGSKIVITTRDALVARNMKSMDFINVEKMSDEENWLLFKRLAFSGRSHDDCKELEKIGREIVFKCKGLPLATKTIGSLLQSKRKQEEWKRILDSELWKLEEIKKDVFSPLLLSYYDLPSTIRPCFLYCTIFPKDYNIDKDELIKLWMAQGYLRLEKNIEMEILGQEYFDYLVTRSFFQDFEKDGNGNIITCKMHDIVHDFARFLNKDECFTMEIHGREESLVNTSYEKIRHLMLTLGYNSLFPISIFNFKRLRSLLTDSIDGCSFDIEFLSMLLGELRHLRVLNLATFRSSITKIPEEIGKSIHLRYLNLWWCRHLEKLPESLCELYNLQNLDLSACVKLKELPRGMGKLINLRHLIIDGTSSLCDMPIGIERLTCLRTLSKFIVSGDDSGSKVRSLECLKNFKHLQGTLEIEGLGNLTNVSESKRIEVLTDKSKLVGLNLTFNRDGDEAVLEALQPPPNLENLWIRYYRGIMIPPHWMMSLTKLWFLRLEDLDNCQHLPPIGKLPSLERCEIWGLRSLKRVDNEFWGIESDATSSSVVLFPKLKDLIFRHLDEWEEEEEEEGEKEEEENIKIMPCLASLTIDSCPKLKGLPVRLLTTLKELVILNCPILEERYKKRQREDWAQIAHIPKIRFNWEFVQGGF